MRLVLETVACIAPAMVLLRLGALGASVKIYFGSLLALLAWHLLTADFQRYFGLIIGTIPVLMPLRKLFLFNILLGVTLVGLIGWAIASPHVIRMLRRNSLIAALAGLTLLYWWVSFVWTGSYSSNLRILDLTVVASVVFLLAADRECLAAALTSLAVSVVFVAFALAPYNERLGIAIVSGVQIGNPIEIGESAGLVFLLATAEDGRWLYTRNSKVGRAVIWISSLISLLLSTSRGGWIAVVIALLVLFAGVRKERGKLILAVAVVALVISGVVVSGHGDAVVKYYNKVASPERSISQKTTLRSDQWLTVTRILSDSPVFGSGPGQGYNANLEYGGQGFVFHSLYLQIGAEMGMSGLTILLLYLTRLLIACRRYLRAVGEAVPLLGAVGFAVIGLSVAGFDPLCGVYMGLAVISAPALQGRITPAVARRRPHSFGRRMLSPMETAVPRLT